MFRRKENPKEDEDLSKVTKVILKDLGGIRVAKHHFNKEGKANKNEENNKEKHWLNRSLNPWNIGIAGAIILALIVSVFVWKEIFMGKEVKSQKEEITYKPHQKFKQIKTNKYPKKKYQTQKKTMLKNHTSLQKKLTQLNQSEVKTIQKKYTAG